MYKTILVTLDTTRTDRVIIDHVKELARLMSSRVVLLHVVSSATAKYHGANAADRESAESEAYLEGVRAEFAAAGIDAQVTLAYGEPAKEIVSWVKRQGCDMVAMATHGHKFVADIILGTTAIRVQHAVSVPVLLIRAK